MRGAAVSANELRVPRPAKFWALCLLGAAALLTLFLARAGPDLVRAVRVELQALDTLGQGYFTSEQRLYRSAVLLIAAVAAVVAMVHVARSVARAGRVFFAPLPKAGIPGELLNARHNLSELFRSRTFYLPANDPDTGFIGGLSYRLRFLTRAHRALLTSLVRAIRTWVIWAIVLCAPAFLRPSMLPVELQRFMPPAWRLPTPLLLVGAFVIAMLAMALVASARTRPRAVVREEQVELRSAGNPVDLFLAVKHALDTIRLGTFPHRVIEARKPDMGRAHEGQTSGFEGLLLIERQPEPVGRGWAVNAAILDLGGAALRCAGYGLLILGLSAGGTELNTAHLWASASAIDQAWLLLAGIVAARYGTHFLDLGYMISHGYRFASDVYELRFEGTFTVGRSGLGDGRGGTIHVQRAHVQSRCFIHLCGARIVTECAELSGPRVLINCQPDAVFDKRIALLLETLQSLDGAGERLPQVDLDDPGFASLVQANAQIEHLQATARQAAMLHPELPGKSPAALPDRPQPATDGFKRCPDCAEPVRRAARKCRFCGYQFPEEAS